MKIVVTGVNGQLGYDVVLELSKRGHEIIATDVVLTDIDFCQQQNRRATGFCDCAQKDENKKDFCQQPAANSKQQNRESPDFAFPDKSCPPDTTIGNWYSVIGNSYLQLDITDKQAVKTVLTDNHPEVVIHCAAYTAVDAAEDNEELCRAVNVEGTRNIAEACKEIGAKMIYISTDYVFSGEGTEPWKADCRDFAPQNVYGRSKLDGEFAVAENLEKYFIVRTAWVFGNHGNNFVKTMLKVGATHDEVRVVNDQIGTPTYTPDLAKLLCDMAESEKYGYYHATNEGGFISWYDFTREIYRQAGYNTKVTPVTTAEYGLSRAKRPANSRLDKSKLEENGFERLPSWQDALQRYLKNFNL